MEQSMTFLPSLSLGTWTPDILGHQAFLAELCIGRGLSMITQGHEMVWIGGICSVMGK
jgi:hypothetical protein